MYCRLCSKKHNTLICDANIENTSYSQVTQESACNVNSGAAHQRNLATNAGGCNNETVIKNARGGRKIIDSNPDTLVAGHTINENNMTQCFLSTALIYVFDANGNKCYARALLDPGSQSNSVTKNFAFMLGLETQSVNYVIVGIGNLNTLTAQYKTNVTIKSIFNEFQSTITCLIIPKNYTKNSSYI